LGPSALVAALALAGSLLAFAKTMLQRDLKFWSFSLVDLARTLLFSVALAALVAMRQDNLKAWQVLLLQATCLTLVAGATLARNLDPARLGQPRGAWPLARQIVNRGYTFVIGYVVVVAILLRVDVLMLKLLDSPLELATYGAASRYYATLTLLLAAVHSVLLPLTQQATHRAQLEAIFARYRRWVWAIVPFVLIGAWLSQWFIPLIDGGRYPGTVHVFQAMCVVSVIGLAFSPYVNLLLRYGDFAFLLGLAMAMFVLDLGLNALLIPRFHALGAAASLCATTGTMNYLVYRKARALVASCPLPALADTNASMP
jgi:O-antigen/teichoic acid export membrane protein